MKPLRYILFLLGFATICGTGFAQCDSTAVRADAFLQNNFVPDGQSYRALLFDDQLAEFHTTFYGGSTYRIIGYAGLEPEQLQFSLFDKDNNELFSNEKYDNAPYWDFKFNSTIEGRISAKLDLSKQKSGCAVLIIGFER